MTLPVPDLAADAGSLDRIRAQARSDPASALKGAAQQFEALFLNVLLKSMRETTSQDTPFDSEQTRMVQSMLDQQLAQVMASRGVGLADMMTRQLGGQAAPAEPAAAPAAPVPAPRQGPAD
jgi:flagellar protein FlgJ